MKSHLLVSISKYRERIALDQDVYYTRTRAFVCIFRIEHIKESQHNSSYFKLTLTENQI
jgi:hypothetical protein